VTQRPSGERHLAIRVLAAGLLVAAASQLIAPLPGPPLYDGVVPTEAYRWLSPPPGEHGGAEGATAVVPVTGGQSPLITLSTTEVPPQAQVFAAPGALTMPPSTSSLSVEIQPVAVDVGTAPPADAHIAGNVYRITITTQTGVLVTAPAATEVTVILRSPDATATEGTVVQLVAGAWVPIKTDAEGSAASFVAIVTTFGDFALLEPGPGPSTAATVGPSTEASAATTGGPAASGVVPSSPAGGISTITIVAGIATILLLGALVVLAIMPRGPRKRREPPGWGR
jgi:hypothetical protein